LIEIIQNIIELLTYTPTLYVDGMMGEVQGAWIGAVIGAVGSVIGAGMSAQSSSSSAKKLRQAAQKNYNMLMENAEMSKMTLNEQMDRYEEDMDSYRSSMIQRYGLAGGIRADDAGLNEVRNYKFDTDEIDQDEIRKKMEEKRLANIEKYMADAEKRFIPRYSDKQGDVERKDVEADFRKKAEKEFDKDWTDKQVTDALGSILKDEYQGRQTNWQTKADNSAILNLQTSVTNMQRDINNAYKAGMIDYWQQRGNAQNVKDTQTFQAAGYSTQARTTLANGFISAIQYGAQAYTQYKSGR
jgi:hypothetical protein